MNLLLLPIIYYQVKFPKLYQERSLGLIYELRLDEVIKNKNWLEFEEKMMQLETDEFSRALGGITNSGLFDSELKTYVDSSKSEFHNLITGDFYTSLAWASRSGARAKYVKDEQWRGFYECLEIAEDYLTKPYTNPKIYIESLSRLIIVNMGQGDLDEAHRLFSNAMKINKNHLDSHLSYFKTLTPKWLGNKDILNSYVNENWEAEIKTTLKLKFLVEIFMEEYYNVNSNYYETRLNFLRDYKDEINKCLTSIKIKDDKSYLSIYTYNFLAYFLALIGKKKEAKRIVKKIKGTFTIFPWAYFNMYCERDAKMYIWGGLI